MSKLRANQIVNKASTGAPTAPNGLVVTGVSTATTFSGSGASLTSIPAGNLTGTVADARISTLTASKLSGALPAISGANLTNLDASDLASGTIPDARFPATLPAVSGANLTGISAKVLGIANTRHTTSTSFNVGSSNLANANLFYYPDVAAAKITVSYNRTNSSSAIIMFGHYCVDTSTNMHAFWAWMEDDKSIRKNLAIDEHNYKREYQTTSFFCTFTAADLGSFTGSKTYAVCGGAGNNRTHTGARCPNTHGSFGDTSNTASYSELTVMEVLI